MVYKPLFFYKFIKLETNGTENKMPSFAFSKLKKV